MSVRRSMVAGLVSLCALAGSLAGGSVAAADECPNAAFRVGPSAHLPECRAYEMVSPPVKDAGGVELKVFAQDGSSALLSVFAAVGGLESFPDVVVGFPVSYYSTQRTAAGWSLVPDDPPASEYLPSLNEGITDFAGRSEDGLTTVWTERGVSQPDNGVNLFVRRPDRSIVDIGPTLPPSTSPGPPDEISKAAGLYPGPVSADASHVFFTMSKNFWPGDETVPGGSSLYEYVGTGNSKPLLVGVNNEGKNIGTCGDKLVTGLQQDGGSLSANGNVVVIDVAPRSACGGSGPPVEELFARVNGGQPQSPVNGKGECTIAADACTVAISEPTKADCEACDTEEDMLSTQSDATQFVGVSEDGSKVFFETLQPLLGGDTSGNVYEYDFDAPAGKRIVRVSGGDSTVSNPSAELVRFGGQHVRASEDGSHVYFVANGVLTRTPNELGESAEAGAYNLYVFEREESFPSGRTAFIARLSRTDLQGSARWDVTPDGRFLGFSSERDLTPDDTSTAPQLFEYDAQTGALTRISVGQGGFDDNGNASIKLSSGEALNSPKLPEEGQYAYAPGYWSHVGIAADGSYVFFDSSVGLTPQAFNEAVVGEKAEGGPILAENVYEYHDGRVSLISDGRDTAFYGFPSAVELVSTDPSGADVFFKTADALVGQDTDTNIDLYDARVDGGFSAPAVPQSCAGEECQGGLSGAPALLSPGSEFQAGGNPPLAEPAPAKPTVKPKAKSAKCKKGFVKKKGKCVRTKAKKASRARRASR